VSSLSSSRYTALPTFDLLVASFSARVKLAFSATATNVAMSWTGNSLTGTCHLASNNICMIAKLSPQAHQFQCARRQRRALKSLLSAYIDLIHSGPNYIFRSDNDY
jgi:hypothetical protein